MENGTKPSLAQPDVDKGSDVPPSENGESKITKSRKDLQWGRRFFHMFNGCSVALIYGYFVTHKQAVYMLGASASLIYLFEQIRINYPELTDHLAPITKFFLRAEERLKESAVIPYALALLLTIISFPKPIAMSAILTLAISDPLSALVGIRFGRNHWVKEKTVEGSTAFLVSTFFCIFFVMKTMVIGVSPWKLVGLSFLTSLTVSGFEMIPLRIDDNLTIPLFTAFTLSLYGYLLGILPFIH